MMSNFYLGIILKRYFVFFFLLNSYLIEGNNFNNGYIRTRIKSKDTNGFVEYIAEVWLGSPRKQLSCNVDFSHGDLIMFRSIESWSKSYSKSEGRLTDVIEISNRIFRIPITYPTNPDDFVLCDTCSCVLGLGKNSWIWLIWSGATFSKSFIEFGSVNKFLKNNDPICNHILIKCEDSNLPHICSTKSAMISGTTFSHTESKFGTYIEPKLSKNHTFFISTSGHSFLPRDIYNTFFDGHNVYRNLPIIRITFKHDYIPPIDILTYTNIQTIDCPVNATMILEENKLVLKQGFGKMKAQVLPIDEDKIILGTQSWLNFIIYYDNIYNYIILESAASSISYDYTVVFFSLVLFVILVRSKLTNCCILLEVETSFDFYYAANLLAQALAIFFSIFVFMLNHARYLFNLNLLNFVTFIFYVIFYTICVLSQFALMFDSFYRKGNKISYHPFTRYILSLWNQYQHEFIIETGLWILLTETNTEEFDNFFTFIIQILIVYSTIRFAFLAITIPFFLSKKSPRNYVTGLDFYSFLLVFTIFISILLTLTFTTLAWIVFFNPFLKFPAENLQINVNILSVCLVIAILLVVFYFSVTRIIKSIVRNLKEEKKTLQQLTKKNS